MTAPTIDPNAPEAFDVPTYPAAALERRFYAFVIDRAVCWALVAGAIALMYTVIDAPLWATIGVGVGTWLLLGAGFALLAGAAALTPGKVVLGLRVVHHGTGTPIGAAAGFARAAILGIAGLPTLCLGVATLAWTAIMDPGRQRRGWHDHRAHSIVVDVRARLDDHAEQAEAPHHIVNLTAMRLVPASAQPTRSTPQPSPQRPAPQAPAKQPPPAQAPPHQAPDQPVVPSPYRPPAPAAEALVQHAPAPQAPAPRPPAPESPASPAPAPQPPAQDQLPPVPAPTGIRPVGDPVRPDDGVGATVARRRPVASGLRWRVSFDTGESFVVEGLGLVGRRPEARQGEPVRHLVPLPSSDMSLSKTHAQIHLAPDGVLVVMDRGSTNGSVLVRGKVSRVLSAGKPTTLIHGDRVRFGDREMGVVREA